MAFLKKFAVKINIQTVLVALCILAVCVGTQQMQTVAWNAWTFSLSRDSLGVLMAVILFTHYKWSDFKKYKIPYIIWSIAGLLACIIIVPIAFERRSGYLKADTVVIAAGIFLMGYCVIHTFISFFIEKHRPKFYLPLLIIWIVMMVLMIFSRSDYLWPECYFVLFLCYYLTPQTPEQRRNVTTGLIDGMILGFILIQGHSLLCRPYDRLYYQGNFCNANQNSTFLCMCLGAILAKILLVTREQKKKAVRIFYFLLAGSCCAFIFMTACRSGYIATFVVMLLFLIAYCRIREKKVFFRMGVLMISLFMAMLPVTYLAVRYIPTIHPHVLFYFQEGYSENWVHPWDARDSEKFITFEQMVKGALGRVDHLMNLVFHYNEQNEQSKTSDSEESAFLPAASDADYISSADVSDYAEETDPNKIPILADDVGESNTILIRYIIYRWYFTHLSLRGSPFDEQGFRLSKDHWIQNTHNIYLDYGINFGYPVMILFTVFIWWGIGRLYRQGCKKRDVEQLICLLIAVIPPVFGMFEFAWGTGMIATVSFYMAFKEMFTVSQDDFSINK
ncbi:MAG: hypothetical protein NC123_06510 [Butyrivibrio sp.]|nr:hypothetical protein [Ruminococcus flavefaciens]MCM1559179.1 hypothetical protein [Butyrivibrio sp.]